MAPRFHVLGPGGIGSLFAFYFHKHNIPFTFFQRKAPPPTPLLLVNSKDNYSYSDALHDGDSNSSSDSSDTATTTTPTSKIYKSYPPTTLKYMDLTSLSTKSAEPQPIDAINWEPLYPVIDKELFRYDPAYNELSRSPIHHLLVTTKTYQTVDAISKIRHRLRPWSTLVLMQNGMGVQEEICETMGWTDPHERPNFVQGIISHGAQKLEDTIVHTGIGSVWIAPTAESLAGGGEGEEGEDDNEDSSAPSRMKLFRSQNSQKMNPKIIRPSHKIMNTPYPYNSPARFISPYTNAPFSSFYKPLSSRKELQALRTRSLYETLSTLQLLEDSMGLKILLPENLLALQLSKLVVNACVNPVATLLECTNGNLLDPVTEDAHQAVKDLLKESQHILSQSKEYRDLGEDLQQEHLTLEALTNTTVNILKATRQNRCSTLQDYLKGSQKSEVEYMNGYLIKMAERDRAPEMSAESVAPFNRMVMEKIKEKFASRTPIE
ncbi:hypothetical protein BGZ80_001663 [Entomortierella chlamydospora]|uniref:2-dehydropantoate 2-reductase n=1 Tax=Entomortierella chlamydospora TaxID=101097 RepID=A0A9P6MRA2_9FUNG|nr:hypothetical protein BGZ79_008801 [Entomortierella chlamydospora]KAG0010224.1 hypothetical protein BGZ80_001663 [Entomortierella chlamydospora]